MRPNRAARFAGLVLMVAGIAAIASTLAGLREYNLTYMIAMTLVGVVLFRLFGYSAPR